MYRIYSKILGLPMLFVVVLTLSQSATAYAQKVSYIQKKASLPQLFEAIKTQTGYNVIWYEGNIPGGKTIDANFTNTPLKEVLLQSLQGTNLSYSINKKTIVIKEITPSFRQKAGAILQNLLADFIDIRGRVLDDQGLPLPGAIIRVSNNNQITRSDNNGAFSLNNVQKDALISVSYIGYQTQEIRASENPADIRLTPATGALNEVEINAGFYTVKQRELTGNITKVNATTIEKQPINNPLQALQNRVPGLEVIQQTGVPGGGFIVRIRGQNSIRSGNEPLYIIDGVAYPSSRLTVASTLMLGNASPLSLINPADIESIEVLKDADATAIYGSRGANGVILITTKKAALGQMRINANISRGFSEVGKKLNLMNTAQYLAMRTEAFKNDNLSPRVTDLDVNGTWDKDGYTDWQKTMIGGKANTTNASLNISGGTPGSNYLLSGNYYNEGTVFPGSFSFKRGGLHSAINFGAAESRFQASFNATYSHTSTLLPVNEPTTEITRAPNAPSPFDEYGQLQWYYNGVAIGSNPMAALLNTTNGKADNLIGNVTLNYRIIKNLVFKTTLAYNNLKKEELKKSLNAARNPATNPTSAQRQSEFANIANSSFTVEPQLSWQSQLRKGKLSALAGMSFQESTSQYRNVVASNFSSDELMENIASATVFSVNDVSYSKYRYAALFARLNYNLQDKYYLNLTARRDGSSRFGPGRQFATFGAAGAAWIFSEESFIKKNLPFLSFGKLRASYGITGNDQIPDYQYLDLYYNAPAYQNIPAILPTGSRNPYFAWETNKKAEAGLQLGFFNDKINIQAAWFRNRSSNQLIGSVLPPSTGRTSITANLPATVQNTGWELEANVQILQRKNWNWKAGLNLSIPKNKLVAYPGLETSNDRANYIIGQPLSIRRYYNIWVDPGTGLYTYEDKNQNGVRDDADKYLNKFIGQHFYGGLQNTISYKQFSLDFFISFSRQTGNSYLFSLLVPGLFTSVLPAANQNVLVLDRWQQAGDITNIPRFGTTGAANTNYGLIREAAQGIADVSYARLKNLSLSYNLPTKWLSKIKIKECLLNLQGQNLLTLTNYQGLDPEAASSTALKLPPLRTFLLGLKITL